ncbi:MAG: exopolysaccharide Pel transporter PelG [Planctomycetota bacterium]|nr:exopolysaccharide Pel transporter PelG [Planctomycetota bacterium]
MAGIGFELRKLVEDRDDLFSRIRAYVSAGLISSGPWIMAILTLSLFSLGGERLSGKEGYELFRALVTYAFAFSLIVVGIGQMAITRQVADLLYSHQHDRVLPAFLTCFALTGVVQATIGTLFCVLAGFGAGLSFVAVSLYVIISLSWLALVWLSIIREYGEVLRAYTYGLAAALIVFLMAAQLEGAVGLLGAYAAGQGLTLVLLLRAILRGMDSSGARDLSIVPSMRGFPKLVAVGLFYNAAMWADKIVFWFADGTGPHPMVRFHPLYDTSTFLAYLTVIPALALNLVRLETDFYERYRGYYGAILGGMPLKIIEERRERMFDSMRYGAVRLLRVQGALTALLILFAPYVITTLELPDAAVRIFRLACLGAFFHVLLLITILMQLYFDLRKEAMWSSLLFLVLNAGLAGWSVNMGVHSYGLGYAVATFISLLFGYSLLGSGLTNLEYLTFTNQPVTDTRGDKKRGWALFGKKKATPEQVEKTEEEKQDELHEPVDPEAAGMHVEAVSPIEPVAKPSPEPEHEPLVDPEAPASEITALTEDIAETLRHEQLLRESSTRHEDESGEVDLGATPTRTELFDESGAFHIIAVGEPESGHEDENKEVDLSATPTRTEMFDESDAFHITAVGEPESGHEDEQEEGEVDLGATPTQTEVFGDPAAFDASAEETPPALEPEPEPETATVDATALPTDTELLEDSEELELTDEAAPEPPPDPQPQHDDPVTDTPTHTEAFDDPGAFERVVSEPEPEAPPETSTDSESVSVPEELPELDEDDFDLHDVGTLTGDPLVDRIVFDLPLHEEQTADDPAAPGLLDVPDMASGPEGGRVIIDVPPRSDDLHDADTAEFDEDPAQARVTLDLDDEKPATDDDTGGERDDGDIPTDTEG